MNMSFGSGFFRRASATGDEQREDRGSSAPPRETAPGDAPLGPTQVPAGAAPPPNLDGPEQEHERRRECWSLLAALQMLRAHLWIGRVGEPTVGLTVILAVDVEQQSSFLIDALRDAGQFAPGTPLYFDTQVEGRRLRFECELVEIVTMDGGPAYRAIDPRIVLDQQRRNAYRVRVPASLRVPAAVSAAAFRAPGRVVDLSTRGCCTRVESVVSLDYGDPLRVEFKLGELDVSCSATVRHLESSGGTVRIGMEFDVVSAGATVGTGPTGSPSGRRTLPHPQHSAQDVPSLEQAVARLQREILRRRQELQQQEQ